MSGIQWAESGQNARCDVDAQAEAFPHTQRQRKTDAERERETVEAAAAQSTFSNSKTCSTRLWRPQRAVVVAAVVLVGQKLFLL